MQTMAALPLLEESDPIQRPLNLQQQRQHCCSRLERFFKIEENNLFRRHIRLLVALYIFTAPALQLNIVGLALQH
jgi:hypothetical protein